MTERELLQSYVSKPATQNALRVIRFAEGTERGGPDSYRVMLGGGLAPDLKQHPGKVIKSGRYASDAAGAYQFLSTTWDAQAKALGLSDFSAPNQDLAATRLLRNRLMPIGGLSTLEKEGFSPRVSAALAPEWASLPTESGKSYYGQPVKNLSELQKVYGQVATPSSTAQQQSGSGQDTSSGSFLQGFLSAMTDNQPKELSVTDLVKQELMAKLLSPPSEMNPLDFLANMRPYG
jgi:muramidase (phage lysozyme)